MKSIGVRHIAALGLGMIMMAGYPATSVADSQPLPQDARVAQGQAAEPVPGASLVPGLGAPLTDSSPGTRIVDSATFAVTGAAGQWTTIRRLGARGAPLTSSTAGRTVTGTSPGVDTIIETSRNSGRIMEVIRDPGAAHDFDYGIDIPQGMKLLPQSDGSIMIGRESSDGDMRSIDVDSVISAPWALDARGRRVDVSYSLRPDASVRMTVSPGTSGVAYPIVADPTVTKGGFRATWSIFSPVSVTIYLNKARTADAEDVGAVICIGIAFVPVVGPVLAAVCGVHNAIIRATSRYGYCQYWKINAVTRSFNVYLYKGGFCT